MSVPDRIRPPDRLQRESAGTLEGTASSDPREDMAVSQEEHLKELSKDTVSTGRTRPTRSSSPSGALDAGRRGDQRAQERARLDAQVPAEGAEALPEPPMPWWGADLSDIDFENIYFIRSTEKQAQNWEDLPEDIRGTWDKLASPRPRRSTSEASAPSTNLRSCTTSQEGARRHRRAVHRHGLLRDTPDLVKEYFGTIIPPNDNKFAPEHRGVVGRIVHLRPAGSGRRHPAAGVLPDQRREHGSVRADADHRRRGLVRALRRGLLRADLHERLAALRGRRDRREEGRPGPVHDDPELVDQRLQPGHEARGGPRTP